MPSDNYQTANGHEATWWHRFNPILARPFYSSHHGENKFLLKIPNNRTIVFIECVDNYGHSKSSHAKLYYKNSTLPPRHSVRPVNGSLGHPGLFDSIRNVLLPPENSELFLRLKIVGIHFYYYDFLVFFLFLYQDDAISPISQEQQIA